MDYNTSDSGNAAQSFMTEEEITRQLAVQEVAGFVRDKFQMAKDGRNVTENIWMNAYLANRGRHDAQTLQRIAEAQSRNIQASDIYIKITKTKIQAVYGQLLEVLFSGNKFPLGIEPTEIPDNVADIAHILPDNIADSIKSQLEIVSKGGEPEDVYGYEGDGREITPGATKKSLLQGMYDQLKGYLDGKTVVEGPSPDKTQIPQVYPAERAAKAMEKQIHDQLTEANAIQELKKSVFECVVLGSGVLKGPFNKQKTLHKWEKDEAGEIFYSPEYKEIPHVEHVSAWNFYPDPDCTSLSDAEYVIQRHLLSKTQIRKLLSLRSFDKDAVKRVLANNPNYTKESWEALLKDSAESVQKSRYEVMEYWGYLDVELVQRLNLDMSKYVKNDAILDIIQVNIWVCGDEVLRVIVNPFTPDHIPYYLFPYEESLYQVWGVGVAENMDDTQRLMNGHMRMAIDNLRLAGNLVFEVNENNLVPGQDLTIYPGKIFRMQNGAPGQSLHGLTFPNTSQSHVQMFDTARRIADEVVGIPSFSHGLTGIQGTGRTAGGISMLMAAAALNVKTIVKNIDTYLLEPLGEHLFYWNMQFNHENVEIRGDLRPVARGTTSLMQREVLTQRLLSLIQVASNPIMAPFLNAEYVFTKIAENMDLDPKKVVNSPEIAKMYSEMIQRIGSLNVNSVTTDGAGTGQMSGQASVGMPTQAMGGVNPSDPTGSGGGNIGFSGAPPTPNTTGFSG